MKKEAAQKISGFMASVGCVKSGNFIALYHDQPDECAHESGKRQSIHYFVCANNKVDYRGSCPGRHYVRADAIEQVVMMELRRMAEYLSDDEDAFAELLARKTDKELLKEQKAELFNLRFQHAIHQLDNPQKIVETKKTIAKILTVLTEKQA